MWRFRKPSTEEVPALLASEGRAPFSYGFVGAIAATDETAGRRIPAGFNRDCTRRKIGEGEGAFTAACDGLRAWKHFPPGWTEIWPSEGPLAEGTVVVMLARIWGVWLVNLCRVVCVLDERGANGLRRVGFAYGTLPRHVERGEERFLVEIDAHGDVWYEIRAASQPRWWAARIAYPLARRFQRKFVADSMRTMRELIAAAVGR
jgi:uncharacterized protein (UPF0548 family)